MTLYRHRGCESPIARYIGEEPLATGQKMRSRDWQLADGSRIGYGEKMPSCPDCGEQMQPNRHWLEPVT